MYISTESPTFELKQTVLFILNSYMPVWFDIKKNSSFTDGPKHVFKVIQTSRYLPANLRQVVEPVIERNSFFAHPENLLLSMVMDDRKHIRELGLRRIIKSRQRSAKEKSIRSFFPPKLNFDAENYFEIIDWSSCKLFSPPILRNIDDDTILSLIHCETAPNWNIRSFPCHTQAVERCVKLVTEASGKVCGAENRDGYIRSTLLSRSIMPEFCNKAKFKLAIQEK